MDALSQLKGSLADRYDIEREIGAGGMATVFLAQDLRHHRPVALKLLNPELGAVLGEERFLAEIRVTANLQHPNLLPLFDSGSADGLLYYVMPFVDGETLRSRLSREKQLPVDEAVRITVAIANALEYAHAHGVIHRDLKPENILLQAGQPVIADFGIALAVSKAGGSRITQTGLSLGTPQYMSPEQATGDRVIDGRSDIYSLGAVAYEMLTGEPPHTGSTAQAIIARMLTDKPRPMRSTRSAIPEHVEFAVQHALEKLPADRFSSAHQFAEAIQGHTTAGTTGLHSFAGVRAAQRQTFKSRLRDPVMIGLAAVAVSSLAIATLRKPAPDSEKRITRFVIATPDSMKPAATFPWPGAISPDGFTVVFASDESNSMISLRTDQLDPRPIPNTSNGSQVIFSPDGESIAFEGNGKLRRMNIDGSAHVALTDAGSFNGADWTSRDEIILGSEGNYHGLSRVSADGGTLTEFIKPDKAKGELDYLWPIASPDGKTVAFAVWKGSLSSSVLATASTNGGEVSYLDLKGIRPLVILDRTLVYVQEDGIVMAVKLKRSMREVAGQSIPVHDPVEVQAGINGNSEIFIGKGGALLTSRGRTAAKLAWYSADGAMTPVSSEVRTFGAPRLSPDGRTIAVSVEEQGNSSIWLYDLDNRTFSKLTGVTAAANPAWSPDGKTIYFVGVDANYTVALFSQATDGGTEATKIIATENPTGGLTVAPDAKSLLFILYNGNSWKLYRTRLDTDPKLERILDARGDIYGPAFSPDGQWIAMGSSESGRDEVFMRPYSNLAARVQISAGGGNDPSWTADGTGIYYRAGTAILKARISKGPSVRVIGRDTVIKNMSNMVTSALNRQYEIARDGRFLGRVSDTGDYQLIVVPNWKAELDQKLARRAKR